MITILKGFPNDTLALRVYYEIATDLNEFDIGAMQTDFTYGVGHWENWERGVVVSDMKWVKNMVTLFCFLAPCPFAIFTMAETAQARAWLNARKNDAEES